MNLFDGFAIGILYYNIVLMLLNKPTTGGDDRQQYIRLCAPSGSRRSGRTPRSQFVHRPGIRIAIVGHFR